MFRMRIATFLLSVAILPAVSLQARATVIDLSWTSCTPLATTYTPEGEPGLIHMFANGTGQSVPHMGWDFHVALENMGGTLPDAWRFDIEGCYGLAFLNVTTTSTSPSCPAFQGPHVRGWTYQAEPFAGNPPYRFELRVWARYPANSADGTRRTLARVTFDHSFSTAGDTVPKQLCGGFGQNICLSLVPGSANWLDAAGVPVGFEHGQDRIYFRGDCHPVPAAPSTWGLIKGQYRR